MSDPVIIIIIIIIIIVVDVIITIIIIPLIDTRINAIFSGPFKLMILVILASDLRNDCKNFARVPARRVLGSVSWREVDVLLH